MKKIYRIAMMMALAVASATAPFVMIADDQVETVEVQPDATTRSDGIKLTAPQRVNFEIYSITGQKVKSVIVESGSAKVELPKGCYIVRCPQWSKKVIVK